MPPTASASSTAPAFPRLRLAVILLWNVVLGALGGLTTMLASKPSDAAAPPFAP